MKSLGLLIPLFALSIVLNSCSSLSDAGKVLRNEKINTTDEFLIKKKEPLTQPPDFTEIPEPGSTKKTESRQNSFEEIIKKGRSESNSSSTKSSSTEESIINQIKK
jgi:hypothetical protein|tara:strand:- start:358 stop:675 length:318 start_codon:yes stop_codon:yes gene_type:complete